MHSSVWPMDFARGTMHLSTWPMNSALNPTDIKASTRFNRVLTGDLNEKIGIAKEMPLSKISISVKTYFRNMCYRKYGKDKETPFKNRF
jgi:hypothetical protein